jgi:hypothetical protein
MGAVMGNQCRRDGDRVARWERPRHDQQLSVRTGVRRIRDRQADEGIAIARRTARGLWSLAAGAEIPAVRLDDRIPAQNEALSA